MMAEREGFEPSKGYKPLLVFKTSAFNRSATSPDLRPGPYFQEYTEARRIPEFR